MVIATQAASLSTVLVVPLLDKYFIQVALIPPSWDQSRVHSAAVRTESGGRWIMAGNMADMC